MDSGSTAADDMPVYAATDGAADLDRKVAFLRQPGVYPERPRYVEATETHMSWVFITDQRVYKLKKPVRRDYLDFSTIEARRRNCLEELRLNRRLAPDVYLDALALVLRPDRSIALGGDGAPIDWLVVMRRLPDKASLQHLLRHGLVQPVQINQIAERLAAFYRSAEPAGAAPGRYRERFAASIELDRGTLESHGFDLPTGRVGIVAGILRRFVDRRGGMLEERAAGGRVVEAHGDLRPEHIFLTPAPVIIDCLEFNRDMRLLDPADELAYLAMECAHLGADWVEDALFAGYARHSGDAPAPALRLFYRCARALLRTRLAIAHLDDEVVADPEKWRRQALGYLDLATAGADALSRSE